MDSTKQQPSNKNLTEAAASGSARWQLALGVTLGLIVLGWIFRGFLWQVVEALMLNVVPILFTPIILELSVAFVGLFIVLLFCYLRRHEHEDEWVYISQVEPEAEMEAIPEPLRKRVGEMVLSDQPLEFDADELPYQAVEGLIELGLFDEAENELSKAGAAERRRKAYVRLRLLAWLRKEDWEPAQQYLASRPAAVEELAVYCVEAARFFVNRKPVQKEPARRCLEFGKILSVNAVVNAIDSDRHLQKLA